jgi:hypothetical protein
VNAVREFSGSVALGIRTKPRVGEAVDFVVDILWSDGGWLITTEVSVKCDSGQKSLQSFPERHATSLEEFLAQLEAAIIDLSASAGVVDVVE